MEREQSEVWAVVEELNEAWTGGRPQDLQRYFHERMVAVTPADRLPLLGRDACVAAWTGYAKRVRIIRWETRNPIVHVHGDTAVVVYEYQMWCEQDGQEFRPAGRDMMILRREAGRWWVVADQFSPYPGGGDL